MSDLIERQAAKEVGRMTRAEFIERLKKLIEEAENDERTEKSSQNVSNGDSISRKAAIEAICTEGTRLERNGTVAMVEIKQWCVDILEALPAAQPERKRGKWIHNPDPMAGEGYWNCSACGYDAYDCGKYCPNCGADMRGDNNG